MCDDLLSEGIGVVTDVADGYVDISLELPDKEGKLVTIPLEVPMKNLVIEVKQGDRLRFRFYCGASEPDIVKLPFDETNEWYLRAQKIKLDFLDEMDK